MNQIISNNQINQRDFQKYLNISFESIKNKHDASNRKIKFYQVQDQVLEDKSFKKYVKITGNIPKELKFKEGQNFVFISHEQTYLTHGLHKYPAKFFPELPKWLIQKYSKKGDCILDPFSGSGTTNLEALMLERNSIGIDVDPFARFVSKVKTTKINLKQLKLVQSKIFKSLVSYDSKSVNRNDIPKFPYIEHWFNFDVTLELAYIKKIILNLKTSENIKNFYLLCFSSIIREVSNASNECTRTVIRKKYINSIKPLGTLQAFYDKVLFNILKYEDFHRLCTKNVKAKFPAKMDARNIKVPDESIDMVLTSPPYINAVDYPRTHQLELYWLGFFSNSLADLKRKHIGTENVYSKDYKTLNLIGIDALDKKLTKVFKADPRRSYIAYKYFIDMNSNLQQVYKALKKNGKYVIIVGNNNIRGEVFENWKYLLELAKKVGFFEETHFSSEIIKHFMRFNKKDKIKKDWIIVLRK